MAENEENGDSITGTPTTPSSQVEALLDVVAENQKEILAKFESAKKRDIWDKVSVASSLVSTVLIAVLSLLGGWWFKLIESRQEAVWKQNEITVDEAKSVAELIPALTGESHEARKAAILTLSSLSNYAIAVNLAPIYASDGGVEALQRLYEVTEADTGHTSDATATARSTSIKEALALAHYNRGHAVLYDEYSKALKDLDSAEGLGYPESVLYWDRAIANAFLGRAPEAHADIQKYVDREMAQRGSVSGRIALEGHVERDLGNYDEAIRSYEANMETDQSADAYYWLGLAHLRRGQTGDFKEAVKLLSTAIEKNNLDRFYFQARAECYEKLGQKEEAEADRLEARVLSEEGADTTS